VPPVPEAAGEFLGRARLVAAARQLAGDGQLADIAQPQIGRPETSRAR
jgi:hypothetical protein